MKRNATMSIDLIGISVELGGTDTPAQKDQNRQLSHLDLQYNGVDMAEIRTTCSIQRPSDPGPVEISGDMGLILVRNPSGKNYALVRSGTLQDLIAAWVALTDLIATEPHMDPEWAKWAQQIVMMFEQNIRSNHPKPSIPSP